MHAPLDMRLLDEQLAEEGEFDEGDEDFEEEEEDEDVVETKSSSRHDMMDADNKYVRSLRPAEFHQPCLFRASRA